MAEVGRPSEKQLTQEEKDFPQINWDKLPKYIRGTIHGMLDDLTIEESALSTPEDRRQRQQQVVEQLEWVTSPSRDYERLSANNVGDILQNLAQARENEGNLTLGADLRMFSDITKAIAKARQPKGSKVNPIPPQGTRISPKATVLPPAGPEEMLGSKK